jgi:hypothetical protein
MDLLLRSMGALDRDQQVHGELLWFEMSFFAFILCYFLFLSRSFRELWGERSEKGEVNRNEDVSQDEKRNIKKSSNVFSIPHHTETTRLYFPTFETQVECAE